jgi:hypothetical protein
MSNAQTLVLTANCCNGQPTNLYEELDGPAVSAFRCAIAEVKQRWSVIGWVSKNLLVGYGPFSLCVIYKEGLYPSSGDINRLAMMIVMN